jgi:CubicO group peptidase (beta-lactamase class C family)
MRNVAGLKRKGTLVACWIVGLAIAGCGGGDGEEGSPAGPAPAITSLEETPRLMDHYDVPGVSIALIKNFSIDRLLVFGLRNQATNEPVTESTQFQAGSISKSVAAAVALTLVQNGRIGLDADINDALVSWKLETNNVTSRRPATLRMLLNHTAGTTVHGFNGYRSTDQLPSLQQILNGVAPANSQRIVVDKLPGESFRYSGGGYLVMQQAVIDLNGKPFAATAKESVLDPLAMIDSTYEQPLPATGTANAAAPHDSKGSMLREGSHIYPELAAAGLWTTPSDLAKFLIEMQLSLEGRSNLLMSQALASEMVTRSPSESYGLGFELSTLSGESYFAHGGVNAGFQLYMLSHETKGVGAVVMTNSDNGIQLINKLVPVIAASERWPNF